MASLWSDDALKFWLGTTGQAPYDDTILSIATESVQARAIELGLGYHVNLNEDTFTSTSVTYYQIETPLTGVLTANIINASCIDVANNKTANCSLEIFEDATTTADGDAIGVIVANYNRNTSETADFTVTHAPTISDNGDKLYHSIFTSGASLSDGITFQLMPATKYLMRVTNTSTVSADYAIELKMFQLPA